MCLLSTLQENYGSEFCLIQSPVVLSLISPPMKRFHRAMTRPFFSKDRISHFDIFDRHTEETIKLMKERLRAGYAVDFQDVVSRFTLDSATEFLFGRCVRSLSAGLIYSPNVTPPASNSAIVDPVAAFANAYAAAFQKAQEYLIFRIRRGIVWPLFEFWGDTTREHMEVVETFLDPIINDAVQRRNLKAGDKPQEEKADESQSLIDHLVDLTDGEVPLSLD